MCGISGIFSFDSAPVLRDDIVRMTNAMTHRGPDGSGIFECPRVSLGHRRLSIIDVDGGAQPIGNEDNSIQVVFNGEIYNFIELRDDLESAGHRFRTRSDTEVIVHAYEQWGVDCVEKFNGMFAFALWDANEQQLFIARDHVGVKPLYYAQTTGKLLFASEIKGLLAHPSCQRSVNLSALSQLFTLRYVPSPDTLFQGIKKLGPGSRMIVTRSGLRIDRYWRTKPFIAEQISQDDAVEIYQTLVEDSVRLQMRSDVPVGLFLSSGVDSSWLLALMSKFTDKTLHTFTIGFEEGATQNETTDAAAVASLFGASHDQMTIGPKDYEAYYERYLMDIEEPLGNESAAAFYFVSALAKRKVKVALTGQGVDEPWAGYHRHLGVELSKLYSRLPRFLIKDIVQPAVMRYSSNERLRRAVGSLDEEDIASRFIKIYSFYTSEMKVNLFQPWLRENVSTDGKEAKERVAEYQQTVQHLDLVAQMLYLDTRMNLPDDLLTVADKTSMANSIESRVPFLDVRIVDFVERLPMRLKLRYFGGKYLHKRAAAKWLPKHIAYRQKKGFANPVNKWLRGGLKRYVGDCLLSSHSAVSEYFDPAYIRRLLTVHESGKQDHLRQIYLLVSFELWHQAFIRRAPSATL